MRIKKFTVYSRKQTDRRTDRQTYTRVLQCSHASVGLTQAHPNNNLYLLSVACVNRRFPEHNHKELIKNLNQKCRDAGKTDTQ